MAFKKKEINEFLGTVLVLSALLSTASALDCHGKSFHCVNSTHFMICVDLGGGVSKSIDNYLISCPPPTICQGTNHFECEFPAPSTTLSNVISETTLPWEEVVVTTNSPPRNTTKEYSEKYLNTERITSAVENQFTTDATVDHTTEFASTINDIIVTETEPIVTESIVHYPTSGLEQETQITENTATAATESITETPFVEERNNTNVKSVDQITIDTASLGFPAIEQAITNTVNGSVSSNVSSNLATETRNATVVNDTRNVTRQNVSEQVTPTPDSLNTETSFVIGTAIDDMLISDKNLLTTDIPVVSTESILYETTALEQTMQTIPENIVTGTVESTTETLLVEQKNYTNGKSVHQITTDNLSLASPTTEKAISNTENGSVSSNLATEARNAAIVNDTRNITKPNIPNVLEQVTPTPDSLNTETSFGIGTAIDDMSTSDQNLLTTDIPVVSTESILYETTALEQTMQTIPENIVTGTEESTTETPLVEQKNYTNGKSVHQKTTDNISLESPTTEKAISNTENGSVSSNLATEARNATIVNDTQNITKPNVPNVLEQVTPTPDSLNTETSFGIGTAIDDMLTSDKNLLTTDIPVVTESILYDTTAFEQTKQTIPKNIVKGDEESTTETPLVEQKNDTSDKSVHQITTDNISLEFPATEKVTSNTENDSVSSNLATETRNATIVNDTQNITKPNVLEQVTPTPDSLNTETSFGTGTAIDDILTSDKNLLTTDIPVVTESILYDTTAFEQTKQTIPKNIVKGTEESTTETPLVEQKNDTSDKSVHQITTDNISLEFPATEKVTSNTENDSVSSNLATETRNATIVNDTQNITKPNVLEQVTPTPDSLNTETSFGTGTAIDDILTTNKDFITTDVPIVTESILYDTTALEKIMQTKPENTVKGTAESTTETPLVEQKNDTSDKSVHQITTHNISLEFPATEKATFNTENGSVSLNLATETRNATIVNDKRNIMKPNVLEQVTPAPDSLNTETSFGIGTAVDDVLTTDKDFITMDIPIVTESILYDTTALEKIMQTMPVKIVMGAVELATVTPLIEQKNFTTDMTVNQITTDKISFGSSTTENTITDTVNDIVFTDVSSNLATETGNATIIKETRNVTKPNALDLNNKSSTDNMNLESATEQAIAVQINGTISSNISTNFATETRNTAVQDVTRNLTMKNVFSHATSPDSLIAETSSRTDFPTAIDYTLTTDNQPSATDILAPTANGVQNVANKNMSDQAKITEYTENSEQYSENSVGTEQKTIAILEKNVTTHPSVSSTTIQSIATESNKLPTITETVLTRDSVIPKYVKVKVTPTTINPIVETSIGTDQQMTISFEEHFPKEVYDIYTTEAPVTLVTNTNALSIDAAGQVSSTWTGDINASIKKANNKMNNLKAITSPDFILDTTENISDIAQAKDVKIDNNSPSSLNSQDAQYVKFSTKKYTGVSGNNVEDPKKYPKSSMKDNNLIFVQENTQTAQIGYFQPSTTHNVTNDETTTTSIFDSNPNSDPDKSTLNGIDPLSYTSNKNLMGPQIKITTPMIDNGPTNTLQLAVENADNVIFNPLANTLFDQFSQASKPNKAGVAENVKKVSTIDKTSPDLDKNSNSESSVSSNAFTDVKSDDKISSEGHIVFTRENNTLQSKGHDSRSLDLLEKTSELPRATETLSPFVTQLKPTIIKDNSDYKEDSVLNGQVDVLQAVELTTDVTSGFTVLESVQKADETLSNFKTTPSETTSQLITSDSDNYMIQPEGNIQATDETIRGNINIRTINDTSVGNSESNNKIIWKVDANSPKTSEATESSPSYKSIEPTSDLTGTDEIQITTEPYKSQTPNPNELSTQENAEKGAMGINSILKTGTPLYNPTEETAKGVVLPPNKPLFEKDASHISLNTNMHVTLKTEVNQASKTISESKSSISGVKFIENNFTRAANLKNLSHSSGIGVNGSSLTHNYTNGGNMQSDLKSEDKVITNKTSVGAIQNQQTKHITSPASTKRIHPRLVSSVTEDPRKQTLDYSCINGIRGRYSDKDNCRKFYICIGNNQPIVGMCPANTVFSDIKKLCTKNMSHCIRENQFKCPSAGRFTDFINDNVFYICVSHKDHLYRFKFQCQKGFTLNKTTIHCLENKEIESNESVSISSDSDDGGSSKFGSSSSSMSNSSSGSSSSRSSGSSSDSSSSRSSGSSSDNDSSSSKSSSKNKKKGEKQETKEDPEEQDDEEVFECEKEGKFPVRNDCRRYYLCKRTKKSQYRRKIKKCDSGDVFHKSKKKCVDAESYEC